MGLGGRIDLLLAIDGSTRRRKHHLPHTVPDRKLQHVQCHKDIHLGIEDWIFHRLANVHLCSKMDVNIRSFVGFHELQCIIADEQGRIAPGQHRRQIRFGRAEIRMRMIELTENFVPFLDKTIDQMRPDKTGSSGHEYLHACPHRL